MVNRSERSKLCAIITELCDKRISGNDFVDKLWISDADDDPTLQMVIGWLLETWDPEWPRSRRLDYDAPPFHIRRQLALFRRFLLSEEPYKWPSHAFAVDGLPMLRLWATGLTVSAAMVTLPVSLQHHIVAPVAVTCIALATWLVVRERSASEKDETRVQKRASAYGDPKWWPFLNGKEYHAAGPSRSRIVSIGVPPAEPGALIPVARCDKK